jgi:hypothetical protein
MNKKSLILKLIMGGVKLIIGGSIVLAGIFAVLVGIQFLQMCIDVIQKLGPVFTFSAIPTPTPIFGISIPVQFFYVFWFGVPIVLGGLGFVALGSGIWLIFTLFRKRGKA